MTRLEPQQWNWNRVVAEVALRGESLIEDLWSRHRAAVAEEAGKHGLCLVVDTTGCRLVFKEQVKRGGSEPGRRGPRSLVSK